MSFRDTCLDTSVKPCKGRAASGSRCRGWSSGCFSPGGGNIPVHVGWWNVPPAGSAPRPLKEALPSSAHRHSLSRSNKISRGSTALAKGVVPRDAALGSASPQAADGKAAYYRAASLFQKSEKPHLPLIILFHPFLKIN